MSTPYHAKYFAYELLRKAAGDDLGKLSFSLFDACVDLNPHQIEAALFLFKSPLTKGVVLADEVGLGKTIEAGLVVCQLWAERKRKLLVICPASLRKQWELELKEKFNVDSIILEAKSYKELKAAGKINPFDQSKVVIISFQFASRYQEDVKLLPWNLAIIDEAHKLRNVYKSNNKMGKAIQFALEDRKKLLLTATPLQNSLLELYGLSSLLGDHIFGDISSFRALYTTGDRDHEDLRNRLKGFCHRTLRKQVLEYINYTERKPLTQPFKPTDVEQKLYEAISSFLVREDTYAIPKSQRTLTTLVLRKLLASSSRAVQGTLKAFKERLEKLKDDQEADDNVLEELIEENELESDLIEEQLSQEEEEKAQSEEEQKKIDKERLQAEIAELEEYIALAGEIKVDSKSKALLKALKVGFEKMQEMGANRKALIFTESKRTQNYLKEYLEANGYQGKIVLFSGSGSTKDSKEIYKNWVEANKDTGRISDSKTADTKTALIEYFRDEADILIATESAAEGVNLQFCSLVINYDLPWNPQRVEQRIGRCHRYGQKHDVVVVNFLNERNEADRRVYDLLKDKFNLFSGVFGASDEVLGAIESGVDFEKRILRIYEECRTPEQIKAAFDELRSEMDEQVQNRMKDTEQAVLEHFDEDVHARLKIHLDNTREYINKISRIFWVVTKVILENQAEFDDELYQFRLKDSPLPEVQPGKYSLVSKEKENIPGSFLYRLSHPLGEFVLNEAKGVNTPETSLWFDVSNYPHKITVVENLKGKKGWLVLSRLLIDSYEKEEYLLFNAVTEDGKVLDQEICEKLFLCEASSGAAPEMNGAGEKLSREIEQYVKATINRSLERNDEHFKQECERIDKWADDLSLAADKELKDTKNQIRGLRREIRKAVSTDEQHQLQLKMKELEQKQRKQRQKIFEVEDEISEKRDALIDDLEMQKKQNTEQEELFRVHWQVV